MSSSSQSVVFLSTDFLDIDFPVRVKLDLYRLIHSRGMCRKLAHFLHPQVTVNRNSDHITSGNHADGIPNFDTI